MPRGKYKRKKKGDNGISIPLDAVPAKKPKYVYTPKTISMKKLAELIVEVVKQL